MTSSFQPFTSPAEFQARIAALWVFPIKSCAGISVTQAVLTPTGLAHDRAWMVVDAEGEMVTQRELPRMALIQPELVEANGRVSELVLHAHGMAALHLAIAAEATASPCQVRVWNDEVPAFEMGSVVARWLTDFLGNSLGPLRLVRFDAKHQRLSSLQWTQGDSAFNQFSDGFPVLVSSVASLDELNTRLQAKGEAAVDMRRFRVNVVLGDSDAPHAQAVMPHDEDRIGTLTIHTQADDHYETLKPNDAVQLKPVKPCPRCPIPNIDPDSAQTHPAVNDALQAYRQDPRVNGALTFGMNCMPTAGVGYVLRVGQRVSADWAF
jgi:uncharacterized protein YcbX